MMRHFRDWFHTIDPARKYSDDEAPSRSELFSSDQMKEYGKILAHTHKLSTGPAANPLLVRLAENEGVLAGIFTLLTAAVTAGRRIAPAGEWLLDNFYLIEEQIHLATTWNTIQGALPFSRNDLPHYAFADLQWKYRNGRNG